MTTGSILLASALLIVQTAAANTDAKAPVPARDRARLGTSFRFDGASLHGKYQTSPSLTATVENDKYLEDLLGARKHFDDRIQKDKERN